MRLSIKEKNILELMKLGWELAYDNFSTHSWVQKNGIGRGGETVKVSPRTLKSLKEKGLITEIYSFPCSEYKLVESSKTLKDLFVELDEQAQELIDHGNSKEIAKGYGMREVIAAIYDYCKKNKIVIKVKNKIVINKK